MPQPRETHFTRIYALRPEEGVFAYARISPSGRFLTYASEERSGETGRINETVRIVELRSGRVTFSEAGIDGYWANDGRRLIFQSQKDGMARVSIRETETGEVHRGVAPVELGDYYSWGMRDGKDLVLTIEGKFYFVVDNRAVLPAREIAHCDSIGMGVRPLLSKNGRQITTFVRGTIVIRDLTDCDHILDSGIAGAKADFSWDGRYVAFHSPKPDFSGYEIDVVDLQRRTVRTVTNLPGSSLFPSWTRDGRLCFRYDGAEYRGFMMAENVLSNTERPLPQAATRSPSPLRWSNVFPETTVPKQRMSVVLVWATWSAHAPFALVSLQRANSRFRQRGDDIAVLTATELSSRRLDVDRMRMNNHISLPEISLSPERVELTGAFNQIPATLLFRDGVLVDRRLGALSYEDVLQWVQVGSSKLKERKPR